MEDHGFLSVGEKAEAEQKQRQVYDRMLKERLEKYEREMNELLTPLPTEFQDFVRFQAWDTGHAYGYEEVVNHATTLVERLHYAVLQYNKRLNIG